MLLIFIAVLYRVSYSIINTARFARDKNQLPDLFNPLLQLIAVFSQRGNCTLRFLTANCTLCIEYDNGPTDFVVTGDLDPENMFAGGEPLQELLAEDHEDYTILLV